MFEFRLWAQALSRRLGVHDPQQYCANVAKFTGLRRSDSFQHPEDYAATCSSEGFKLHLRSTVVRELSQAMEDIGGGGPHRGSSPRDGAVPPRRSWTFGPSAFLAANTCLSM